MTLSILCAAFLIAIMPDLGGCAFHIDCVDPAIIGRQSQMTCRGRFGTGVHWYRPDGKLVRECNKIKQRCPRVDGYSGRPHVGGDLTRDTLLLHSFDQKVDGGNWTCRDGRDSRSFATCWLGPTKDKDTLHIDCLGVTAIGIPTSITCHGGFRLGVHWYRPDGKIVRSCDTTKLNCSNVGRYHGRPSYGGGIASDTLILEYFDPKVDGGGWTCRDGRNGTLSVTCRKTDTAENPCVEGFWGQSCSNKCGNCKGSKCEKDTGKCTCKSGWAPPKCTASDSTAGLTTTETTTDGKPPTFWIIIAIVVFCVLSLIVALCVYLALRRKKQKNEENPETPSKIMEDEQQKTKKNKEYHTNKRYQKHQPHQHKEHQTHKQHQQHNKHQERKYHQQHKEYQGQKDHQDYK
ncbi:scavenger receptor class F member 1-like [Gigantopelta aegis]|uniref:scavenger receptor class F member 1-like n=1 Tax=Gigantopelta aegis TaxID=1735272 RepID=UPI001B88E313|nr:scavenger receptor class F member 1-like [Gigantopelta aegis]